VVLEDIQTRSQHLSHALAMTKPCRSSFVFNQAERLKHLFIQFKITGRGNGRQQFCYRPDCMWTPYCSFDIAPTQLKLFPQCAAHRPGTAKYGWLALHLDGEIEPADSSFYCTIQTSTCEL
jgi:hypothetical protein